MTLIPFAPAFACGPEPTTTYEPPDLPTQQVYLVVREDSGYFAVPDDDATFLLDADWALTAAVSS